MSNKNIKIWKPIEFSNIWLKTDTSTFDELASSWYEKRKEFKEDNKDYIDFIEKLKRQHAIETGIIEKLYDLSEGITQTFIKEGFIENLISHEDTNIPVEQLMGYLKSQFDAMDFVFDMIKNNRPLTKSFIKELHQLILRHQEHTIAIDSLGNTIKVPLLKGKFKEYPNNPQREDGTVFEYCPPIHVDAEIDNLLSIYNDLENRKIHPIILSSWFHHAFTQIHPFQDGNGRMARMLSSLILIKHHLFPLNILRNEKTEYIKALEKADNNQPNDLVKFFSKIQRRNIESALNIQTQPDTLKEVAEIFKEKVEKLNSLQKTERLKTLKRNRDLLTKFVYSIIGNIQNELFNIIPIDKIYIDANSSNENNNYYYTKQIIEYANQHNYFFNKNLERNWYRVSFIIAKDKDKEKRYDIIISIHHFGYFDSVVAIGSFVEFIDSSYDNEKIKQTIPLNIKPYTLSLENELSEYTKRNIEDYLRDVFKVGLTLIINEIS